MSSVSIITPAYNSSKYIRQTIDSVLDQTYEDWEMIIVDDCSRDNTVDIVNEYSKDDGRIKCFSMKENSGPAKTRNFGISKATGRYIAFLDSDDIWTKEKLSVQIEFMKEKNISLCYSSYLRIDESGQKIKKLVKVPEFTTYKKMLYSNVIPCLTVVYDSHQIGKKFMPELPHIHEDYALWLDILKNQERVFGISEPLAMYRVSQSSKSGNKFKALRFQWRVLRNIEKISLIRSIYLFFHYIFRSVYKRVL